jgi:hypothetical protein
MDLSLLWVAIAAFGGTMSSAIVGWLDSGQVFNPRKFFSSVLRGFVAAGGLALIQHFTPPLTWAVLLSAYLAGAGVDVLGNRIAGAQGPKTVSPSK